MITADTTFVAIYAQKCTVTFEYESEEGATITKTWYVAQGATLAEAVNEKGESFSMPQPVLTETEDGTFTGWVANGDDGVTAVCATEDLVVDRKLYFTPKYSAGYTVTLYDVDVDGNVKEPYIDIMIPHGKSL